MVVGNSATPQTTSLPYPGNLTVDLEDLLITGTSPANPTPLLWDPTANNGAPLPLPLSATFTAAYKATGTAAVKIYTSENNVTPIRTLTQPFTTTDGRTIFSWDGTADPIPDGKGGFVPGQLQSGGVYLFKFSLNDSLGSSDSDKSNSVICSSPAMQVSDDGTTAVCTISFTSSRPDSQAKAATMGQIDLFDPTLVNLGSFPLSSLHELNSLHDQNLLNPGPHTVSVSIPSPQYGISDFILSIQDNDASTDRAGRNRYALQIGKDPPTQCVDAYVHDGSKNLGSGFAQAMRAAPFLYKKVPHEDWWRFDPPVSEIRYGLQYPYISNENMNPPFPLVPSSKGIGIKLLRVLLLAGHGSDDGATLCLAGPPDGTLQRGLQTMVVPSYDYIARDPQQLNLSNQNCLVLDTIVAAPGHTPPNGSPLDNLDLVVLTGCSQAISMNGSGEETLGQKFIELGAKCVVVVGDKNQGMNALTGFLFGNYFQGKTTSTEWGTPGFLALLKTESINQAYNDAKTAMDNYARIHEDTGSTDVGFSAHFKAQILPDANAGMYRLPLQH